MRSLSQPPPPRLRVSATTDAPACTESAPPLSSSLLCIVGSSTRLSQLRGKQPQNRSFPFRVGCWSLCRVPRRLLIDINAKEITLLCLCFLHFSSLHLLGSLPRPKCALSSSTRSLCSSNEPTDRHKANGLRMRGSLGGFGLRRRSVAAIRCSSFLAPTRVCGFSFRVAVCVCSSQRDNAAKPTPNTSPSERHRDISTAAYCKLYCCSHLSPLHGQRSRKGLYICMFERIR